MIKISLQFLLTVLLLTTGDSVNASTVYRGLALGEPESVGMSPERLQRVSRHLQDYVESGKLSGIVSLVARQGRIVHFENFGHRNLETGEPMKKDTLVRIYSMSKPIVAAALMSLHEEGKFQLNDSVAEYIPEFEGLKVLVDGQETEPDRPMTVQHLLTHTAGLTYGFFGDTEIDQQYRAAGILRDENLDEMIDNLAEIPLQYHPGERWHYSVAVDVQGYLIEVLSGMPLDQFLRTRIFEPLGMDDTFFQVPENKIHRFAANYTYNRDQEEMRLTDPPKESKFVKKVTLFSGGGGLVSTAADYWRFCQMMLNKGKLNGVRILGRKTVELMTVDHLPAVVEDHDSSSDFGFGLGFRVILDVPSTRAPGSAGEYNWGGAAGTIFWIDPKEDLIAIVMIQLRSSPYDLRREAKSLIYQAIVD